MNVKAIVCAAVLAVFLPPSLWADEGDAVLGLWTTAGGNARVKIAKRVETVETKEGTTEEVRYDGKIVWVSEVNYGPDDPEAGKPRRDRENPDESKRDQPLVGLEMVANFTYGGENLWKDGKIYDPENGRTYKCQMTLKQPEPPEDPSQPKPPAELHVRGYLGIPALGRTTVWKRYKKPEKAPAK